MGKWRVFFSFFEILKRVNKQRVAEKVLFEPKTDAEIQPFGVPKIEIVPIFSQSSSLHALCMLYII